MSYILDALRKSENQRRIGQTPDLGSAPTATPRPARRAIWTVTLIGLAAVAAIVAAGFWWLGKPANESGPATQIVQQAPAESATGPQALRESAQPDPQETQDETPVEVLAEADEATNAPAEAAAPVQRRRRTVVDRRSPDQAPVTSVSRPAPARPGAVRTPPPVVPDGERERLVSDATQAQQLIEAQQQAAAALASGEADVQPPASGIENTAGPNQEISNPADQTDWAPQRSEFIEVWDLPLAIRRELPDLSVSIHVFSTDPEERFVLINGERRQEETALGDGARLVEVAREGAIVEFRDYRFLLRP